MIRPHTGCAAQHAPDANPNRAQSHSPGHIHDARHLQVDENRYCGEQQALPRDVTELYAAPAPIAIDLCGANKNIGTVSVSRVSRGRKLLQCK